MSEFVEPYIRFGHDTLADAFGDKVYIRRKSENIESPFTGRWVTPEKAELSVEAHNDKWVSVEMEKLLKYRVQKYFIPRKWNPDSPWISYELLREKYDNYLKEKANV